MMNQLRPRILRLGGGALLATLLLFLASGYYAQHTAQTAASSVVFAEKAELRGVPNFGRVSEMLYRGGQPTPEGFTELKKLGVEVVVNFRNEPELIAAERGQVEALGLRYVSIPWSSWHGPVNQQVAEFLELLRANPHGRIFVHCHHGADRTGVMVAAYRIAFEHWASPQALAEMDAFHFHRIWLHNLKSYVEHFPQLLVTDSSFQVLHPATHASTP